MSHSICFSIGLVYFSGKEDLILCVQSLLKQKYHKNFEIIIKDQSPSKEGKHIIESEFVDAIQQKKIRIWSGENHMHSGGHNEIWEKKKYHYYIVASIDMEYEQTMLTSFANAIQRYPDASVWGGKIIQYNSKYIDSVGIEKTWYGVFREKGFGKPITQYQDDKKVFGISGALFCISSDALKKNELLFENSIHYKNDIELMQRLQANKKKIQYFARIIARHKRTANKHTKKPLWILISSFKGQYFIFQKSKWYEQIPMSVVLIGQWMRIQYRILQSYFKNHNISKK